MPTTTLLQQSMLLVVGRFSRAGPRRQWFFRIQLRRDNRRLYSATVDSQDPIGLPVSETDAEESIVQHFERQQPLVLRNLINGPILSNWNDLDYMLERGMDGIPEGSALECDIEAGWSYNDENGEQLALPYSSYLQYLQLAREHEARDMDLPSDQILYLAQNDLNKFGKLIEDVDIPNFCTDGSCGLGHLYQTKLWLGPRGCFSSLHYDPLDNILMQIVGRKRIALLPASAPNDDKLYSGKVYNQQYNTSAIPDILAGLRSDEERDEFLQKFPNAKDLFPSVQTAILEPGDAIYIPSKWWHQVESLTFSASVNAWWR